ncbi:MAG: tyrosine-type recombinase/integrase [Brevinematales bacterium]|jgi:integrase/recombinase XerD
MSGLSFIEAEAVIAEAMKYRNYTRASIESYLTNLKMFDLYLRHKGVPDYREVKEKDYYDFLDYTEKKSKRGIKRETLGKYGITLKRIFALLEEEEKILQSPFAGIETMKNIRRIREMTLTEDEMDKFLSSVEMDSPIGIRNRVILETLYGTGIRARELMNLDVSDFLKEERMLFIRNGKGQKDRIVPLGPNVYEYLKRYLSQVRPKLARRKREARLHREKALFLGKFGFRLGPRILERLFDYVRKKSRIGKHVTPHVMRHSFATHLINGGADIREVQLLLGHASISSTEIYVNLASSRLKEVYEKYHPLENELFFDVRARESYILDWQEAKK